ncbi:MAG TPA: hypothetical protein VHX42_00940 [Candidatus Babeliales bacterium]|jgi:hypothetical protein|nr:hypothetical protein [Candidatus Babeliales bacterium]
MKQYVVQLLVLVSIFCNASAMEKVCYLNRMPRDILDYIAIFLTCDDETDEQFIARIRLEYEEKKREREEGRKAIKERGYIPEVVHISRVKAYNIDQTKVIFCCTYMKSLCWSDCLDRNEEDLARRYSYQEEFKWNSVDCIALSPQGRMFAWCYYKPCSCEQYPCEETCKDPAMKILEITKIDTQKKEDSNHVLILKESRELHRGESLHIDEMFFNKQGNKLIAYNSYNDNFNPTIFSLKNLDPSKKQVVRPTTNKLQEYLRDKFICSSLQEIENGVTK